jgi:hypothetical protein
MSLRKIIMLMPKVTSGYDPDVQAFITAADITDVPTQICINNLVISLKAENIWNKIVAIYPFVGGTSGKHKWNLKDPRDLDVAFRLSFFGGVTHSSLGAIGNGLNGYANTFITPTLHLSLNNTHISHYNTSQNATLGATEIGAQVGTSRLSIQASWIGSLVTDHYDYNNNRILANNSDARGFYVSTRTNLNDLRFYKNTTLIGANTADALGFSNLNIPLTLFAMNTTSGPNQFSDRACGLSTIGSGLTQQEVLALENIVRGFENCLGRQIQ